jgi:two-component system, cell cycle sensor histidine kinase and response regulator CckA
VASPSQLNLEQKERAGFSINVSLEDLPFAAAIIDARGLIEARNREWTKEQTEFLSRDAIQAGVRTILRNESRRYEEEFEDRGNRYRITITPVQAPSGQGALVLVQALQMFAKPNKMPQSEKMETVGRLLGGVVHDFANLLTLISGYSEILLNRTEENNGLRDELDEIRKASNRGARLTGQLLAFTRGQTAQSGILDLNEIVTGIVRMLRPIIGEHLNLETALNPDLCKIVADPGQMEQVLMNLVLNARDAMPHGGKIVVETRNVEISGQTAAMHRVAGGRYVMLSVSDTGHGIEPAMLDRLWEPLFTTKPEGKGTGLGLNTVRNIIQENRGAVWVQSTVGQGTTFFVCLPEWDRHSIAPPGTLSLPLPLTRTAKNGTETVLIVEDEDGVRRLLRHVLEIRGYKVMEASDGEDALRVYQASTSIDLVLTDMIMPRMGGRELAGRLFSIDPDVKIIFMSGYTDDVLVRTGELGRGMSFLQKPLRPEALAGKVREALDSPSRPFNPR